MKTHLYIIIFKKYASTAEYLFALKLYQQLAEERLLLETILFVTRYPMYLSETYLLPGIIKNDMQRMTGLHLINYLSTYNSAFHLI